MISNSRDNCPGCMACYNICPKQAIEIVENDEGFLYPVINEEKCIKCNLCSNICNKQASVNYDEKHIKILAAWSNDETTRLKSSSGGCFTEFAKYIFDNKGVVFGAGYNKEFEVTHKEAHDLDDLNDLRGSKYVQSIIGDCYKKVKSYLESNKLVLFSGTPCQVAGLYKFLNRNYDNLYTCDLVCHGVPSPKVFRKYKLYLQKKYNSDINTINFRDKVKGWKIFSFTTIFKNGKKYSDTLSNDKYIKGFLNNIYLRPSCYDCKYSKIPRQADISLGDFWGVQEKYSELDDDKGTSLLLINSKKGEELLDKCSNNMFIKEINDLEYVIKYNPCIIGSVKMPNNRNKFFEQIDKFEFDELIKNNLPKESKLKAFINRCKNFIKTRLLNSK